MAEETRRPGETRRFEEIVLPHLDAAHNLARWLVRNPQDAEDVVQEAFLRAFRFFGGYQGGDVRCWLLKIVRNTGYTWLAKNRSAEMAEEFNEEVHRPDSRPNPEAAVLQTASSQMLHDALEELPLQFREAIVLRELEGLSYKEIAEVMEIPIGTVMSSLARGRARLKDTLLRARGKEPVRGLHR